MKRSISILIVLLTVLTVILSGCNSAGKNDSYPGGVVKLGGLSVGLPDKSWRGEYQGFFGACLFKEGHYAGEEPTVQFHIDETDIDECIRFNKSVIDPIKGSDFELTVNGYEFRGDTVWMNSAQTIKADRLFYAVSSQKTLCIRVYVSFGSVEGVSRDDPELAVIISSIIELNSLNAGAQQDAEGNLGSGTKDSVTWKLSQDGVLTITTSGDFTGYSNPEEYPWYALKERIVEIRLPDGVTVIPAMAFENCYALKEVNIPDSVNTLGLACFCSCRSLETVTLPQGLTKMDFSVFEACSSLTEITIPGSLAQIDNFCFMNCTSLRTVRLSSGVQELKKEAFCDCSALTELYLPATVTVIGQGAIYKTGLTDLYYEGSEEDFARIRIEDYNDDLLTAAIHYNAKP